MTDKLRDAAQQALEAYCRGWHKSFAAENPYDRISITDESRKHILAGLVEALASLAQQDAQAVPTQRQYEMALRQWDHWKSYALELQAKLVKYEGGSPMVLNTSPTTHAQQDAQAVPQWANAAFTEIAGCFDAAIAEGLLDALAETRDERLKDLVVRRLMYAHAVAAQAAAPTLPAQRVTLTDDEWFEFWDKCQAIPSDSSFPEFLQIGRAVIEAYEIKNGTNHG